MTEEHEGNGESAAGVCKRPLSKLVDEMNAFGRDTDAWQDFAAAIEHIMEFHADGLAMNISVAPAIYDYWIVVATGGSSDYTSGGARTPQHKPTRPPEPSLVVRSVEIRRFDGFGFGVKRVFAAVAQAIDDLVDLVAHLHRR